MKMNLTKKFQDRAESFFDEIKSAIPVGEIETRFREAGMTDKNITAEQFEKIYDAYLAAQIAQRWNFCCLDQKIDSKEIQNLFFKVTLDRYAAAKDLEGAAFFSEAMYAANSDTEQATLISILTAFFKKISSGVKLTAGETADLFRWAAGIWDGYSSHFENSFDDFLAELRLEGAVSHKKRG